MDSKVKRTAIAAAVTLIAVVLIIVLYLNGTFERDKQGAPGTQQAGAASEGISGNDLKGFLNDETFWDPEPSVLSVSASSALPRLFLQGSSVMRDIRLSVLDDSGNAVTGQSFYVNVDGLGEFKDLDQDGMIYIPELKEGEYFVTLEDVDGYEVPKDPLRISVKSSLEYKVIDDIALYIRSEDEINAEIEDTAVKDAESEADDTEVQRKWEGTDAVLGIDVSKWQKDIDWQAVAGDGIDFVIIRCGYRGSSGGALVEDPYFRKNLEGAKAAGLKTGVYFFTQAVNEVEAVEEASMVVELLNGASLDMPVFIDTEGSGGRADLINRDMRTAVCKAFCETINNAGYRSGIYASRSWYYNKLKDGELSQYTHWVAEYRKNPLYKDDFALWQYTSKGAVNGINTKVDMDLVWSGN